MILIRPQRSQWETNTKCPFSVQPMVISLSFLRRVVRIWKRGRERIEENGRRILKSYAMLLEIRRCLALIPLNRHSNRV
jgi:hypothetical protein